MLKFSHAAPRSNNLRIKKNCPQEYELPRCINYNINKLIIFHNSLSWYSILFMSAILVSLNLKVLIDILYSQDFIPFLSKGRRERGWFKEVLVISLKSGSGFGPSNISGLIYYLDICFNKNYLLVHLLDLFCVRFCICWNLFYCKFPNTDLNPTSAKLASLSIVNWLTFPIFSQ